MVSRQAARLVAGSPAIADAHFRAEREPYHPAHRPDGYLNLGTAENRLVWDLLEPRIEASRPLSALDVRYAPLHGTAELREAVAGHLTRRWHVPADAEDIVVVSGATAALDIVATVLCDPGEVIVLPAPYYGAFDVDLGGRSNARLVAAPTGSAEQFQLSVDAVAAAVDRARDAGTAVRAIALASPSNPVGLVYPVSVLGELAEVARRGDIDLIADEIYAGSVFGSAPFASLLDPAVNPRHRERTHMVWGFAKDFGLPGFKVGLLYSPDRQVRAAARALAYFAPTSTQTQALLTDLLTDEVWLARFAAESRRRLADSYTGCAAVLAEHGIGHIRPQAGFSVWIDLRPWLPEPTEAGERTLWTQILTGARVNILPGSEFASPEPGWFRLCHTTESKTVAEGVRRIAGLLRTRIGPRSGPVGVPAGIPATLTPAASGAPAPDPLAERPARRVRPAPSTGLAAPARPGPFDTWYEVAGVRSGVRRMVDEDLDRGKQLFPTALVPHLTHEAVGRLPAERQRELVIRHLYQFLLSTTHLETRVVNRGAERIANGRSGVDLPISLRLDAFKVYCDEGYHALYSLDLAEQVAAATGVEIPPWDYGGFVAQLERTAHTTLPSEPLLAQLLQVVVFETLVTAVLNEVPNDSTVVTVVRDLTRDHARDEGRHHRFFSAFFHRLWSSLDGPVRERAGPALPPLIHGCLRWDIEPVRSSLLLAGLDEATTNDVVADCYGGATETARIAEIATATVRMCQSAGLLDVPGTHDAFERYGLLQ